MTCSDSSEPLDLDRGLPVSAADVEAQRRIRPPAIASFDEYLEWLASFPAPSYDQLKRRRSPRGEPFVLHRA